MAAAPVIKTRVPELVFFLAVLSAIEVTDIFDMSAERVHPSMPKVCPTGGDNGP